MSLKSWKAEFYPIPTTDGMPRADAIRATQLKWSGSSPENLARHEVLFGKVAVVSPLDSSVLPFRERNCALCRMASSTGPYRVSHDCAECPITQAGYRPCDEDGSPFMKAFEDDGESMRKVLSEIG